MKKEKLIKNKKRGQGFVEYALIAGMVIIVVAGAFLVFRPYLVNDVPEYLGCLLRVATRTNAGETASFAECASCIDGAAGCSSGTGGGTE